MAASPGSELTPAETIFALSSGAPPAAIGVVRVSGPGAGGALCALFGRIPPARRASYGALRDPADGALLDRGLALWFPGPGTATGEDLAELHIHGGRAVGDAVLAALARMEGLRPALPGEFTRRAFANGRIDLAEAEGLADLLAAETDLQRRVALASAGGALSRKVGEWRATLIGLAAQVEAILDFADEDDVAVDEGAVRDGAARLAEAIAGLLDNPPADRLRDGIRVVLAGPPNVGKSTLFNVLAGREAAIVSPVAGTTRDVIEAPVALNGMPFLLSDTAGLRTSDDAVERIGIDRAGQAMEVADIVLWLGAPAAAPAGDRTVIVSPRCDVADVAGGADIAVSALTGRGIGDLVEVICRRARDLLPRENEISANLRQRDALRQCCALLRSISAEADLLIVAEQLRAARNALDHVTGVAGVEEMLDALFDRFCIGK